HEIKQKEQEGTLSFEMAVPSAPPTLKSASEEPPAVIYRSTDLGKTWSSFAKGIPEEATLSGIKQDGNKVYVATDYHGIFSSTDGQNNWIPLKSNQLKHLDINCIEADDHKLVIGTLKNGIFVSNDEGTNWTQAKIANDKMPIRAFIKSQGDLYAGTDSGIFRSTDMGDTWLHVFGKVQILGFTALNNKLYAASQNGVLLCNVHPSDWESIYEGDALHDIGNDGEYIYAMTIGQQLLKTNNDGKQWDNAQNGILQPANFYTNELKHVGQDIFSAQWIGIYHSSNHGSSWNKLSGLPDSTAFSTLEITDYGIIAGISIR
ncbi:MAG: hypothetical protein AAFP19_23535, partial [Bacteroidota bacterium]